MNVPTKEELRERIAFLEQQNDKLTEQLEADMRKLWESRLEKATGLFFKKLHLAFGGSVKNARLDHIDKSGYWFSFELINDDRKQIYAIRHTDLF